MSIRNLQQKQSSLSEIWNLDESAVNTLIEKYFRYRYRVGHVTVLHFARVNKRQPCDILRFLAHKGLLRSHCIEDERGNWWIYLHTLPEVDDLVKRFSKGVLPGGKACRIQHCLSPCVHHRFGNWPICTYHVAIFLAGLVARFGEEQAIGRLRSALSAMQNSDSVPSVPLPIATAALMLTRSEMKTCVESRFVKTVTIDKVVQVKSSELWRLIIGCGQDAEKNVQRKAIRPVRIQKYIRQLRAP